MVTVVIWLSTVISFASCVFVAIAGKNARPKFLYTPLLYAVALGALASVFGLIGAIQLRGTPATYMFSLFGLPVHEGFRVTEVTASSNLALYIAACVYLWRPWRWLSRWSPWYPSLWSRGVYNESDTFINARAYPNVMYASWITLMSSLIILAPTLAQGAGSLYVAIIAIVIASHKSIRLKSRLPLFDVYILYALIGISFLAQTTPTWMAWAHLHTVELIRLRHASSGQVWHTPAISGWLSLLGFIGEAGAVMLMTWLAVSDEARRAVVRMSVLFGFVATAYLVAARAILMANTFDFVIYILDILLEIAAIVVASVDYHPAFAAKLTWLPEEPARFDASSEADGNKVSSSEADGNEADRDETGRNAADRTEADRDETSEHNLSRRHVAEEGMHHEEGSER